MTSILIVYSTVDGHTRKICERLRQHLEPLSTRVTLVAAGDDPGAALSSFDKIVIGASIRYGRHRREVYEFIAANRSILEDRPSAFFSVNAVARKPERNQPDTNPYLKRFLAQIAWQPKVLAVFAGKIDYPKYRFYDRWMIQLIMHLTKGPTDRHAVVEFTNWDDVEAFARRVAGM